MIIASKNIAVQHEIFNPVALFYLAQLGESVARLVRKSYFPHIQDIYEVKPAAFYQNWPLKRLVNERFYHTKKIKK